MTKTKITCNQFLSKIICAITLMATFSCGKAVTQNEGDGDNDNALRYLETRFIKLNTQTAQYSLPGNAQVFLPAFLEHQGGETQPYLQLVFSKGVYMQEFTCFYDYSANSQVYELDECYLADDQGESLGYKPGQLIYQAKDDTIEIKTFNSQGAAQIEVTWFSQLL